MSTDDAEARPDLFPSSSRDPVYVMELVRAARTEVEEVGGDRGWIEELRDLEELLSQGQLPVHRMEQVVEWLQPEVILEHQLRELAARLTADQWQTEGFAAFAAALGVSSRVLAETRQRIDQAWLNYSQTPVTEEEVTAQTVVSHRILQEGLETWQDALDEAEDGSQEEALALAEAGNRLLVAVQIQAQRVEQMATSPQKLRLRSRRYSP